MHFGTPEASSELAGGRASLASEHHRIPGTAAMYPGGGARNCAGASGSPSGLRSFCRCDPVVFAPSSLDHRLVSIVPPGHMHPPLSASIQSAVQALGVERTLSAPAFTDAVMETTVSAPGLTVSAAAFIRSMTETTDAVAPLTDAATELTDAVTELTDAVTKLTDAVAPLTDAVTELTDAVTELTDAVAPFTDAVADLTDAVTPLTDSVTESVNSAAQKATVSGKIGHFPAKIGLFQHFQPQTRKPWLPPMPPGMARTPRATRCAGALRA